MDAVNLVKRLLGDISDERSRQLAKWGPQRHPPTILTLPTADRIDEQVCDGMERAAKADCDRATEHKRLTWWHILNEELAEFNNARTDADRRQELIQLTAVCFAALEDLDSRPTATEDSSR